ncbi:hypothetical protein [Poriferisphaera sp. WC338]|uniref:hypothetical protein n=1 Tax=Poriferisphaera sp. WC338 TaxID=3425129 RepID=UPI003D81B04D
MRHSLYVLLLLIILLTGCTSPPSVVPVLEMVGQVLADEAAQMKMRRLDEEQRHMQMKASLRDAYERDLTSQESLSSEWVLEATSVYTTAREMMIENYHSQLEAIDRKQQNLMAAWEAQQKATELLRQQDDLLRGTVGLDLWRLEQGVIWNRSNLGNDGAKK